LVVVVFVVVGVVLALLVGFREVKLTSPPEWPIVGGGGTAKLAMSNQK
jgi:hypothetical protein